MEKSKSKDFEAQKEIQKKYLELQLVGNQLKQVEKQLELFESQILEALTIVQSLEDIKNAKTNTKSLAPLANGIFVETKLENVQNLLVNVGSGVVVRKTVDDTKQMLESQVGELRAGEQELLHQFEALSLKAQELQKELTSIL